MPEKRYLTAQESADMLDVSLSTVYAYVSRGLIRSESVGDDKRQRRYHAEDVEKLLNRREGRRSPESAARRALHWGDPVLESAITLIDGGHFYYRGHDVRQLVHRASVEEVAALIWTGDMQRAGDLFELSRHGSAHHYETMLLHLAVDGADLDIVPALQAVLPVMAADDPAAYDLRPAAVAQTGARILRLMSSLAAGDVSENGSVAAMLQHGWCPDDQAAVDVLSLAMIVCADHELNASSFAARVVASAGATPYAAVAAGLGALQGVRHGGYTEQVRAMLREAGSPENMPATIRARQRRGEQIPGFGHRLYPDGDPRAALLIEAATRHRPDSPDLKLALSAVEAAETLLGEKPTLDTGLVVLAAALNLPESAPLTIFALGRTIGWIGHAIEQYESEQLIRPRARYTGPSPQ